MKKILYIDMDNVLVDFRSAINRLNEYDRKKYENKYDEAPGIFNLMDPMPGAMEAIRELTHHFDIYILSTAAWLNPSAWSDKLIWVQKHFGDGKDSAFYKRLILSHHKNLNSGDFLVDDRPNNGAEKFTGEWVLFDPTNPNEWNRVKKYLMEKI